MLKNVSFLILTLTVLHSSPMYITTWCYQEVCIIEEYVPQPKKLTKIIVQDLSTKTATHSASTKTTIPVKLNKTTNTTSKNLTIEQKKQEKELA